MKTGTKIFLLIGILLLALGLTILQIANHRGISFNAGLVRVPGIHTVSDLNYDQKGYTVLTDGEESFPAGEVRALKLDWSSGSVDVERYNGSTVLVREEAKRALKENECLRYKLSGGELSILPCANRVSNLPEKHLTVFGIRRRDREGDPPRVQLRRAPGRGLPLRGAGPGIELRRTVRPAHGGRRRAQQQVQLRRLPGRKPRLRRSRSRNDQRR